MLSPTPHAPGATTTAAAGAQAADPDRSRPMPYTVLIVDDSAITRAMIKRTLKLADLPVQTLEAPNGKAALLTLAAEPVQLVLADLNMPEMDGVEMTRHMRRREQTRHIPVVVISAEPSVEKLEALKAEGVSGYLRKPFTPEGIRDLVSQTLGGCHAH